MKALLVDDERYVVSGMSKLPFWERLGVAQILTAQDGAAAYELFVREKPDLVITDMYMPGMNGLELIRRIRDLDREIPIIVLSGYNNFSDVSQAMVYGVVRYILKPSMPEEMESIISEALNEYILRRVQRTAYENFAKDLDRNLEPLQEGFAVQTLLHGLDHARHEELERRLSFLRLDTALIDGGTVVCLRIFCGDGESEQERIGTMVAAMRIVKQRLGGGCFCRLQEDLMAAILPPGFDKDELRRWIRSVMDAMFEQARIETAAGVSDAYAGIDKCRASYKQALAALEYAQERGFREIAFYSELPRQSAPDEGQCMKRVMGLINTMGKGNTAEVMGRWQELRRDYLESCRDRVFLHTVAVCLLSGASMVVAEQYSGSVSAAAIGDSLGELLKETHSGAKLLAFLDERMQALCAAVDDALSAKTQNPYVQKLKQYVKNHYNEPISLYELAREMHLSRNYLSNVFTKVEGMSFITYLTRYRIAKAKELFRTTSLLICEVGRQVGYAEPAYFSRVFKQVEGVSPQEYLSEVLG